MTDILDLVSKIANLKEQLQELQKEPKIKTTFTNSTESLNTRWSLFKLAVDHGVYRKENSWALHFKTLENKKGFCWYDTFGIDRLTTVDLVAIVAILEEDYDERTKKSLGLDWSPEDTAALKEEILQQGYSHFVYDW
jgi:hypothetical protein